MNALSTTHPIGSTVTAPNGKTYTVVGYMLKNGIPTGSMVTVANDEGIRFVYPASQLTPEA